MCVCVCLFAAIKEKYSDWTEFLVQDLTGSRTAPANLLEGVSVGTVRVPQEGKGASALSEPGFKGLGFFPAD